MTAVKYFDTVRDTSGEVVPGSPVYVYDSTGALASLLSQSGGAIANPVYSRSDGFFSFYINPGTYAIKILGETVRDITIGSSGGGETYPTVYRLMSDNVVMNGDGSTYVATPLTIPIAAARKYQFEIKLFGKVTNASIICRLGFVNDMISGSFEHFQFLDANDGSMFGNPVLGLDAASNPSGWNIAMSSILDGIGSNNKGSVLARGAFVNGPTGFNLAITARNGSAVGAGLESYIYAGSYMRVVDLGAA